MQTWSHYDRVPIFYNLTQMELFSNLKGKSWPKKWMWMLEMLQHSPKLQHLIIHEVSRIIWFWYLFCLTLPLHILTFVFVLGGNLLIVYKEIENRIENGNDDEDIWEDPKIVPECLSSQLKTCLLGIIKAKSASFNLQNMLCAVQKY